MVRLAALFALAQTFAAATVQISVLQLFRPAELHVQATAVAVGAERIATQAEAIVTVANGAIVCRVGGRELHGQSLSADGPRVRITVPGKLRRSYPGSLVITVSEGALRAVVSIGIEDAVAAVVSSEMPHAPDTALQALAIAARSYFLAPAVRHKGFGFCDTTHCQLLQEANAAGLRAARSTAGQVLVYQNMPVAALYFRSCAGRTMRAADVKMDDTAYPFPSVPCAACLRHPQTWEVRVPDTAARRLLEEGPSELLRLELARSIGWNQLASNSYTTETQAGTVVFRGKGHGHGVGMCQNGAAAMARDGKTARQILAHYYPDATVR